VTRAVGLVGAGRRAALVHAPGLAASPDLELAGVWTRRPAAADELAGRYGVPVFADLDHLLAACDAVCFAVPPAVQAELAVVAARAGSHLLLEAPLAWDLAGAELLAQEVDAAGVVSQVAFTWRYLEPVRDFLLASADGTHRPEHATGHLVRAVPVGRERSPWRRERSLLFDVGPHVVDLLDASLGRIIEVSSSLEASGRVELGLRHRDNGSSEAVLSFGTTIERDEAGFAFTSASGSTFVRCSAAEETADYSRMYADFAAALAVGEPGALDVHRGLHVQHVIEAAATGHLQEQ
jgi:predicted dehydrogenase